MVIVVLLILAVVGVVLIRRRHRRVMLAGLTSAKPQFMVSPPTRRLTARKDDRL